MNRILISDDDLELCEMLQEYLVGEGFVVDMAHDGEHALRQLSAEAYDLLILDIMMPIRNGLDVLRELRKTSQVPVLMLTARGSDVDSVVGLELGADDYIPKPCNPRVLVARIRAVLRRSEASDANPSQDSETFGVGDITVYPGAHRVEQNGNRLELTSTEYSVLACLLRHAGQVVGKDQLSKEALGRRLERFDRSLDMHISNLRRKLGPLPGGEERIHTVRGVGYLYTLERTS